MMSPWLQAIIGILGVLVGIYLVVNPGKGALASIWAIGTIAIAYGILMIIASFRIRSMRNDLDSKLKAQAAAAS